MGKVINMFDHIQDVGYCGNCGNDLFMLLVDSNSPEDANVIALRCGDGDKIGCGEVIELAPIIVECDIEK